VEALVREFSCLIARSTVYASLLTIFHGCLVDLGNGMLQILVHGPIQDWIPDVIPQIERSNQQYVDSGDLCNGIYLDLAALVLAPHRIVLRFNIPD